MEYVSIVEQLQQAWRMAAELQEAIERARALHVRLDGTGDSGICEHCQVTWPCATMTALALYQRKAT